MNAVTQFNVLDADCAAPIFPMLTVWREDLPTIEGDEVTFTLAKGEFSYINVTLDAKRVSDETEVNFSSDPQEGFYMDYDVLEVQADTVGMVSDFDEIYAVKGMPVRITEAQRAELNLILADMAKDQFEKDLAA